MATHHWPLSTAPVLFFRVEPKHPKAQGSEFAVILAVQPEAHERYKRGKLLDGKEDIDFEMFVELVGAVIGNYWPVNGLHCYPHQNPGLAHHCAITNIDTLAFIINEANHLKQLTGETITLSTISPAIEYDPPVGSDENMELNYADLRGNAISMIEDFAEAPDDSDSDDDENWSESDLEIRAGGRIVIFRKFGDMEDDYHFFIQRGDPRLLDTPALDEYVEEFMDLVLECNGKRVVVEDFMGIMNNIPQKISPEMFRE